MGKRVILVGYARCGVTVLNRYFAGDKRLVCLSEINSRFVCPTKPNTPHEQMKDWYGADIPISSIIDEIVATAALCDGTGRTLLVRDWSFGSFVSLKYNESNPTKTLNTLDDLDEAFWGEMVAMAFVRHPIDVWLSMSSSVKTFHDRHLVSYRDFVVDLIRRKIPIFKYEDFCHDADAVLGSMYELIGLDMPTALQLSNSVIGDINFPESSRGANMDSVRTIPRRKITDEDNRFLREESCAAEIAALLSYSYVDFMKIVESHTNYSA